MILHIKNCVVTIDKKYYELIRQHARGVERSRFTYHVYTMIKGKKVYMPLLIMGVKGDRWFVKHRDRNYCNNTRLNLYVE